jgi:hypothetical protein
MNKTLRTAVTALMLTGVCANAWAENVAACANPQDISAVRVAAVQQQLMVAALSCHAIDQYNNFVVAYRKDLQASDLALQGFFTRLHGQAGTADYHAFKTRLANTSSMDSIHDIAGFCANAQAAFDAALNGAKPTLATFVAGQTTRVDAEFTPCPSQIKPNPSRAKTVVASGGGGK